MRLKWKKLGVPLPMSARCKKQHYFPFSEPASMCTPLTLGQESNSAPWEGSRWTLAHVILHILSTEFTNRIRGAFTAKQKAMLLRIIFAKHSL